MIKTIKNIAILTFSTFLCSIPHVQGRVANLIEYDQQILNNDDEQQTCQAFNAVEKVPANSRCGTITIHTGAKCFIRCTCLQGYKKSASGACIAKKCADYDTSSSETEDTTRQNSVVIKADPVQQAIKKEPPHPNLVLKKAVVITAINQPLVHPTVNRLRIA
jgi:hypothetical protein